MDIGPVTRYHPVTAFLKFLGMKLHPILIGKLMPEPHFLLTLQDMCMYVSRSIFLSRALSLSLALSLILLLSHSLWD